MAARCTNRCHELTLIELLTVLGVLSLLTRLAVAGGKQRGSGRRGYSASTIGNR